MIIKGYKIFNPDWTCRGKQYACPGEFVEDAEPIVCKRGMHFCPRIIDCMMYYPLEYHLPFLPTKINKVAAVVADKDDCDIPFNGHPLICGTKYASSRLKILHELSDDEILMIAMNEIKAADRHEIQVLLGRLADLNAPQPNSAPLTYKIWCYAYIKRS